MGCNRCTTKKDLGCYGFKDMISVDLTPTQSGTHVLEYNFLGAIHKYPFGATIGQNVTLPQVFNESRENCFRIKQPDGTYLMLIEGSTVYDWFSITSHTGYLHLPPVSDLIGVSELQANCFTEIVNPFFGGVLIPTVNDGILPLEVSIIA